jgi:sulfur carrier protein
MNIELNGTRTDVREGTTVAELVVEAGVDGEPRGVAVALDGEVVPRSAWATTTVRAGQTVEVLEARQGG